MKICKINLKQIDFTDHTFRLALDDEDIVPAELSDSITRIGVLHPPIAKEKRDDCYCIINGRKRLLALRENGIKSADCLVTGKSASMVNCLALSLEDALQSRTLTPVGRALFCAMILKEMGREETAERFLPIMGFPPRPVLIDKFAGLLQLEKPLLIALDRGELDEKTATEMVSLSFDERLVLFEIISLLKLSVGNQRKFTRACRELAARNNISIRRLLTNDEVDAVLNHATGNLPQKVGRLMRWIHEQRFPRLSAAEQEFRRFSRQLQLTGNITLAHSPSFEKDEVALTITFPDRRELHKYLINNKLFSSKKTPQ